MSDNCKDSPKHASYISERFLKDSYASKWNSEYATEYSYFKSRYTVSNVPISNSSNAASLSLHNDPTDKFRFDDQFVLYRFEDC
jgi:hypothetical protein